MLYKQGRGTKVWGKEVQVKVVDDGDVERSPCRWLVSIKSSAGDQ